jgi:hypothetical protein
LKVEEDSAKTVFSPLIWHQARAGKKGARMLLGLTPLVVAEIQDTGK